MIFTAILLGSICSAQENNDTCGPEGHAQSEIERRMDLMKNRDVTEGNPNPDISLDSILKGMPEDTGRYKLSDYATVTGYVLGTDDGGPEACNCFSTDISTHNTILYIGHSLFSGKDSVFIAEITPKFKAAHPGFIADDLFGLKISISGYMMYNFEMKKMALNGCKKCHAANRKTAWEICPVTGISVFTTEAIK